jgi:hypothetical protein
MKTWKRRYFVWTPADKILSYYSEGALHRTEKGSFPRSGVTEKCYSYNFPSPVTRHIHIRRSRGRQGF